MPLVSGVCRTASAPKPSHGGSRLNASKPEANPKTRCPLYKNTIYIYTWGEKVDFWNHTATLQCAEAVIRSLVRGNQQGGRMAREECTPAFTSVRVTGSRASCGVLSSCVAPRLCPSSTSMIRIGNNQSCISNIIESPPNRLELAPSKAPSIFIITRQHIQQTTFLNPVNCTPEELKGAHGALHFAVWSRSFSHLHG